MTHPLAKYLAHRPPMILIDQLVNYQPDQLTVAVTPSPHAPFFDDAIDGVPSWVGIEYMAQAVATLAGIEAEANGEPIRIGFLLGTRRYQIHQPQFDRNCCYHVSVNRLYQDDDGMAAFDCLIQQQQQPVAEARINVFQPRDPNQFLGQSA
ncbi:hotdog family protein [Ferrimonas senticii]|uniref:ApeP family dehydratase n=1 Tax=Ferrimonas senticii TaxID=394566 RepID=UPI000429BF7A|nr:hotdog family protein [Ferrimonas senticii]